MSLEYPCLPCDVQRSWAHVTMSRIAPACSMSQQDRRLGREISPTHSTHSHSQTVPKRDSPIPAPLHPIPSQTAGSITASIIASMGQSCIAEDRREILRRTWIMQVEPDVPKDDWEASGWAAWHLSNLALYCVCPCGCCMEECQVLSAGSQLGSKQERVVSRSHKLLQQIPKMGVEHSSIIF